MPITATCPNCAQVCQVDDQYAGMMVRCPKCGNIIQASRPSVEAIQSPPPVPPPPQPAAQAPLPSTASPVPRTAGPGFMETIQQSATAFGLDPSGLKLIYAGVGCLGGMVLFTFFPWYSASVPIPGGSVMYITTWGIATTYGALNFLLSAAAISLLLVVLVVMKKKDTFDISLWAVGVWSALGALCCLIQMIRFGHVVGIGLVLTLLASLGGAGAFGFIIYQRFIKKRL